MGVIIHAEPAIAWQVPFAHKMRLGLKAIGIDTSITTSRCRESDVAILLGTTCWRQVEDGGQYLLVDRCSFGDTNKWVSLVWNGHGRRGDHKVPAKLGNRWRDIGVEVAPWDGSGKRRILCGQTETYSPHYQTLSEWYDAVEATHFRRHPAGDNPTNLPVAEDFEDVATVITLNSSIAVETVINGLPTVTMDEGSMAWDVTSHVPHLSCYRDRQPWLNWLAWTQWSHAEVAAGAPIKHLFEGI